MIIPKGGINVRLKPWDKEMAERNQCVSMRNLRYNDEYFETVLGTKKYHGTSLGTKVTAIMPYYNDQTDDFVLLAACGDSVYKRNPATNEFTSIASGLTPDSIFSSVIRHGVQYIASTNDGLKKYLGGNQIESVGGGNTAPGSFKFVIYAKEVDRLFGISEDAILGQISWCELSDPETWDGASVERFKLKDGERVEGGALLYGKLVVFCTYTTWIYYIDGNEENWKLEEAPTTVGCVAGNTIRKVGNEIWFLGESLQSTLGVYAFNGTTSRLLTDDITPYLLRANPNKIGNACAEVHDDLYTFSYALDASDKNNVSFDLDISNIKKDETPAIYGPHDFYFYSSAVLNTRQNNKEFLMGDETDGFVYVEGGTTLKGVKGDDGGLLQKQFTSRVHNNDEWNTMKRFNSIGIYFHPRGFYQARLRHYLSYGGYGEQVNYAPQVEREGFAGDFNAYESRIKGVPGIYEHREYLGLNARGTSIQVELINDSVATRISFQGYDIDAKTLYTTKKAQAYVA